MSGIADAMESYELALAREDAIELEGVVWGVSNQSIHLMSTRKSKRVDFDSGVGSSIRLYGWVCGCCLYRCFEKSIHASNGNVQYVQQAYQLIMQYS